MKVKENSNINYCEISSAKIAYKIHGKGQFTVIIEPALGSCSAEWWHIAEKLSDRYKVLVYERAGYGKSSVSKLPRTPENIANRYEH